MKFKAKMDIDLNENDLMEKEVQDAFKAYAKNVAREAIQDEVSKEIERVAANYVRELRSNNWYSGPKIERLIKDEINSMIRKEVNNMEDITQSISSSVTKACSDKVNEILSKIDIEKYIIRTIEQAIPKVLLAHMANNLKA